MTWHIALAFLLSGAAGLMHEIVWSKMLATLIGTTAHAQAAVLVVYMGGLALGSVIFGRDADRRGHSLRRYMQLEFAIAVYCLALPVFLGVAGAVYVWVAGYVFESAQLKFALRFATALLTVITPAVLMGGTLPLLASHVIHRRGQARRQVAALYALNNLGAVGGAAVAGFLTLPALGVYASLVTAAVTNVVAGILVWPRIGRDAQPAAADAGAAASAIADDQVPTYSEWIYGATLAALFLSGFAAMAYEVVFIRVIALAFGGTTYSFTVMLMSFITGIGLGSLVVMRLRIDRPLWLLGLTQLVAGIAFLAATPIMERLPYFVGLVRIAATEAGQSFLYYQIGKALLCLAVLLVPTMCIGAGFPLVAAIQTRQPSRIGSLVGGTYACNTLGNVTGILVTTLILVPSFGMLGSFHIAVALSLVSGAVILIAATEATLVARGAAIAAAAVTLAIYATSGTAWPYPLMHSINHMRLREGPPPGSDETVVAAHPASSFASWKREFVVGPDSGATVLYLREEAHANVMVASKFGVTSLVVNTKGDASTGRGDMQTQLLLAHVPLFMHLQARSLLVIGYGSGITVGSALRHPIEHADVVEISQGVLDVSPAFATHSYDALNDPRVSVYVDDAQSFLRTVPQTYDVIISEPSNPWISGIAGLFTVEFFEVAQHKLNPNGVFAMWFHQYDQSDEAVRLIVDTFRSVFPHVTLFAEEGYDDVIAIGSLEPLAIDPSEIENRFDRPEVRNDLARLGISNLLSFFAHHAVPTSTVAEVFGGGPVNRALEQRLEYISVQAFFRGKDSQLTERISPLLMGDGGTLVDAYMAFREASGDPVRLEEIERAAQHMGERGSYIGEFRAALMARAEGAPDSGLPQTSVARGAAPDAASAGYYDSTLWASYFTRGGDMATAEEYLSRADALRRAGQALPGPIADAEPG